MATRIKCQLSGTLGTPATEAWSIGLNYIVGSAVEATDGPYHAQWAADIESGLDDIATLTSLLQDWGSNVALTQVDTYGYSGTGGASVSASQPFSPVLNGATTPTNPFQVARCITLQTAQAGARRRGRVYMPALSPDVSVSGKGPVPSGYLTAVASMFNIIGNAWPGPSLAELGVYSAVDDVVTPVTQLRIGDVLDTQRRRRDTLPEVYQVQAYVN